MARTLSAARTLSTSRTSTPTVQNLLTHSRDFSDTAWTKQSGVTVTPNQIANPIDGAVDADLIDVTAASAGNGILQQALGANGANGRKNTKSIFARGVLGTEVVSLVDPSVSVGVTTCNLTTSWSEFTLTENEGVQSGSSGVWVRKVSGNQFYLSEAQLVRANWSGPHIRAIGSPVNNGNFRNLSQPLPLVNRLVDGDMEAATAAAYTEYQVTASKETVNPHGGSKVLRIAHDGVHSNGFAYQSIHAAGKLYRITGWARSNGVAIPTIYEGSSGKYVWIGTNSANWQPFDVFYVASGLYVGLACTTLAAGRYVEFDDVRVIDLEATPCRKITT